VKISREHHAAVQISILQKLEELGVDTEHDDFAMLIILLEPNGRGGQTLHLGAYHMHDDEVRAVLEQAPSCVHNLKAQEYEVKQDERRRPS